MIYDAVYRIMDLVEVSSSTYKLTRKVNERKVAMNGAP
jgi:hypothetical protein